MSNQGLPIDPALRGNLPRSVQRYFITHCGSCHKRIERRTLFNKLSLLVWRKEDANLGSPAILIPGGLIFGGAGLSIVNRTSAWSLCW